MGTNSETVKLQKQIKELLETLGWSRNKFAEIIYSDTEQGDIDDQEEIHKFAQRLNKSLQRPTTKPELLERYLKILLDQPQAKNLDAVSNTHIPLGFIKPELSEEMRAISREIDEGLKRKYSNDYHSE